MITGIVKTKSLPSMGFRIDPDIHLSEGVKVRREIKALPYELSSVGDNAEKVFLGNIFSRVFVSKPEYGLTYLAASDTVLEDLQTGKYLSHKQSNELNYLKVKKGWILVTCSGTLGNVTYTNSDYEDKIVTHDLIRIVPNDNKIKAGVLYAFLSSKYGYYQINQSQFGGVVKHINDTQMKDIMIPVFPSDLQDKVDALIKESARLREEATKLLNESRKLLKQKAGLPDLTVEDYNYFGPNFHQREISCFTRSIKDLGTLSFHAFNYSERVRNNILGRLSNCKTISFYDALDENKLQSPSGVTVNEVKEGHGIMLINQSDIFDKIVKGKYVAKKPKYTKDLLKEGEILIAKIGTLGESESFCRCVYVGEELKNQLISSAFYRFRPSEDIPTGYLYAWMSSDYGFRLIRSSQYGTKQCYPNPAFLYKYPVPILDKEDMEKIDEMVKEAHHKQHIANNNIRLSIQMIEQDVEKWNK